MRAFEGVSALGVPWVLRSMAHYVSACDSAEREAVITSSAALDSLTGTLVYDKRKGGNHGRCLGSAIGALDLQQGDRLEPSVLCPDPSAIDECESFPLTLKFWRSASESLCNHRNPVFHLHTGVTPQTLCVDELHTMHLGVFQSFVLTVCWKLITGLGGCCA